MAKFAALLNLPPLQPFVPTNIGSTYDIMMAGRFIDSLFLVAHIPHSDSAIIFRRLDCKNFQSLFRAPFSPLLSFVTHIARLPCYSTF
ncbi:uncharacterized protein LACBIDRAFT_301816 [Laccaria bicolor S238N-H82]|uniref:Predicted protein n=1 Tax=Laccaria bicolor (strain S238N-H82 / ATCC MYA-4686) TaxID=486041 RepID=B0CPG9_LACBS|nr:uncharacterized protein LACBIDRAFT_301816 [Laccaria bicolor S238N-H82]EDR15455.1 predicted protein [Laccaria bicolor S238N-H82]|eukprot:XP_001873663.1 predicted protein [Laccaria bicolor S238N-H82]